MKVRTKVKAGRLSANHNVTVRSQTTDMKVKTKVQAGRLAANHNTTVR